LLLVSQERNLWKRKEFEMAYGRGHITGHKKERKGATPEFDRIQAEHLARIEAEWQAPVVPMPFRKIAPEAQAWTEALRKRLAAQVAA
jgi:hypothetical protein